MKFIQSLIKSNFAKLILILFIINACSKDDNSIPTVTVDKYNIDIGSYNLLPESLSKIPYNNKHRVYFKDSNNALLTFDITETPLFHSTKSILYRYNVYEIGDTVQYHYATDSKSFVIKNDSLQLQFELNLRSNPYSPNPESKYVADITSIILWDFNPPYYGEFDFYDVTNKRTWPDTFNISLFPEKEFIGKVYYNVLHNNYSNPKSDIYFNYEFGIVSLTDNEKKQWRFERLE